MLILFETSDPAFVEVDAGCERLNSVCKMLIVDLHTSDVSDQATKDLEVECIPLRLPTPQLGLARSRFFGSPGLGVESVDNDGRIEKQLQQRVEQLSQGSDESVVRLIQS